MLAADAHGGACVLLSLVGLPPQRGEGAAKLNVVLGALGHGRRAYSILVASRPRSSNPGRLAVIVAMQETTTTAPKSFGCTFGRHPRSGESDAAMRMRPWDSMASSWRHSSPFS